MAFALGGVLKGAVGVGAPFLAIPTMALLVDVPFAVAVFLIPNIISNSWQVWRFRLHVPGQNFAFAFAITGIVGAGLGTIALAKFSSQVLTPLVAIVVLAYVGFRLLRPGWSLNWATANKLVRPMGGIGGFFQGALGLSGPISVSFMNAVGLDRPQFIFTMSLYFLAMTTIQLPMQMFFGVMTIERAIYGAFAMAPMAIGMMLGSYLARRISKQTFDKIIFAILTLLALRLLADNFF